MLDSLQTQRRRSNLSSPKSQQQQQRQLPQQQQNIKKESSFFSRFVQTKVFLYFGRSTILFFILVNTTRAQSNFFLNVFAAQINAELST